MRGKSVKREIGYPDEMQAREMIIAACQKLGSRAAFCREVGLSKRYVNLIMEWLRPPTHWKLMSYFGWNEVYATPEDLLEFQLFPAQLTHKKRGRPRLSDSEKLERWINNIEQRRAYWRQKQDECRSRRRESRLRASSNVSSATGG